MRLTAICSCIVIGCGLASCGTSSASPGSGSGGSAGDGGVASDGGGSSTDAGTGQGGASDAGTAADGGGDSGSGGGSDGGSGGGGGGSGGTGDGGSGGTTASDCDGLMPAAPGAPLQFRWAGRDLVNGSCSIGDVDGTGHIALLWQDNNQPGDSHYLFVDSSTGSSAGSYTGTWLLGLIGQLSGFMGADCFDTYCTQGDYVVLSPTGGLLYRSGPDETPGRSLFNDPTGGMIRERVKRDSGNFLLLLDAIDASGGIRWTRQIPDVFPDSGFTPHATVGVDRKGNVLAIWSRSGENRGQWFDHDGNAGPVFVTTTNSVGELVDRVGDGLFVYGGIQGVSKPVWIGQFEPFATTMSDPPEWLRDSPIGSTLHMVHDGRGYAVLPREGSSETCEQSVSIFSPSGQLCGTTTFSVGGGNCFTERMTIGYDGTVVQQLPRARESNCAASPGVSCDCTYRYWPGYFR